MGAIVSPCESGCMGPKKPLDSGNKANMESAPANAQAAQYYGESEEHIPGPAFAHGTNFEAFSSPKTNG